MNRAHAHHSLVEGVSTTTTLFWGDRRRHPGTVAVVDSQCQRPTSLAARVDHGSGRSESTFRTFGATSPCAPNTTLNVCGERARALPGLLGGHARVRVPFVARAATRARDTHSSRTTHAWEASPTGATRGCEHAA